jgi:hypothetical protein
MKFLLALILLVANLNAQAGSVKGSHEDVANTYGCGDCTIALTEEWRGIEPTIGYPLSLEVTFSSDEFAFGYVMFSVAGGPIWQQEWGWPWGYPGYSGPCMMWLLNLGIQVPFLSFGGTGQGYGQIDILDIPADLFKSTWYTQAVLTPVNPITPQPIFMSQAMSLTIGDKL